MSRDKQSFSSGIKVRYCPPYEQYLSLVPNNLTNSSKGNPGGDVRIVCDRVEKKAVVLVVDAQCPMTNLSEDTMGEVDTDDALDLPLVEFCDKQTQRRRHGR